MIGRVTSSTMTAQSLRNLQGSLNNLAKLQEQATSQKQLQRPSDNPSATAKTLSVHGEQARAAQHGRNITDALAWAGTVDTAINSSVDLLQRARDLTVQGANGGVMSAESREAIAVELDGIRDELLARANTTVLGRTVFAGTSDAGQAFGPGYSYTGTPGAEVTRRIDDNSVIRVDADGAEVFGAGDDSVFALLDNISAELRDGQNVGSRISDIDERMSKMLGAQGAVGARMAQIERAKASNLDATVSLEEQRAQIEDVDSVEVLMKLRTQETVYQNALSVTARTIQPSLLDFLN